MQMAIDTSEDNKRLRMALARINMLASPNPSRTFDGLIRDTQYITSIARGALDGQEPPEEHEVTRWRRQRD